MKGTALVVVWKMLMIMLLLYRELGLMLAIPTAMLLRLLSNSPAGPQLLLFNPPAGITTAIPPFAATSLAATLPKTTNGKRMGVAHLRFVQTLHFAVGIRCVHGMLYEWSCDARRGEGRAFLDIVAI